MSSLYIYLEWDLRGYYNPGANPSELYIYLEWDLWGYYNPGANPSELYIYLVWDLRGCYNPGANPSELYIYLKWDLWGYYNPVLTPVSSLYIYISGVRSSGVLLPGRWWWWRHTITISDPNPNPKPRSSPGVGHFARSWGHRVKPNMAANGSPSYVSLSPPTRSFTCVRVK